MKAISHAETSRKMHTRDGEEIYEAGQAFYWAHG
jgi:hypothetical protein